MALRDYDRLRKQADALTERERVELAKYLLSSAPRTMRGGAKAREALSGSLKLSIDPLEFQRSIRAEWP
jgi:hypothetical protein